MYNQNQQDILKYADHVLENDFPVGVFMVMITGRNIMAISTLNLNAFLIRKE